MSMSEPLHPLADRYLDALYDLPDELRVRRALEDRLAQAMTGGQHVCIRGFWRIGKTTLLRGLLQNAVERTGGVAFSVDLRDPARDDGLPQSVEAVLGRVAAKVQEVLQRAEATELKVDPLNPLAVLADLAAPFFVGFDELICLAALGPEKAQQVIDVLLTTPKNVKVAVICHRHRDVDALFEQAVVARPRVATAFVPPISDEELVNLVQTPALALGVSFSDEALGAVAELSGNRPWEVFSLCSMVALTLPPDFKGTIAPEQVEAFYDLDVLAASEQGTALVDNCLRTLVTALSAEERSLIDLLVAGAEGEVPADALERLLEGGLILQEEEGMRVNGTMLEGIARALAEGTIKVSIE
jgi:hypothetical protein